MAFKVEVVEGDIIKADVEVIVNAANNKFWMGSGVAGAIKAAGGQSVEDDAMAKGQVMPGEAVFSTAGKLPYSYIIHGAVMGQDLHTSDKLIRQTTISCLKLAEKLKVKSIAFPAFGTGVGGFPMQACAKLMVTSTYGFISIAESLERVQFCLFDAYGYQAFKKINDEKMKLG